MLQIINQIMDECIPNERPNREFQVKFPDEILQDHLGVQLWFAAEVSLKGEKCCQSKSHNLVIGTCLVCWPIVGISLILALAILHVIQV